MLVEAELQACDSNQDRVSVLKKLLPQVKEIERLAEELTRTGQLSTILPLRAKADRLQIEIALERAQAEGAGAKSGKGSQ